MRARKAAQAREYGLQIGANQIEREQRKRQREPEIEDVHFPNGGYIVLDPSKTHDPDKLVGLRAGPPWIEPYVRMELVRRWFDVEASFTVTEAQEVYNRVGGPLPANLREQRERIDHALAEMVVGGGEPGKLALVLGIDRGTLREAVKRGLLGAGKDSQKAAG